MANGRFLSKTIAVSAQLARVSDQAELLFYRMLAHADRDGRLEGDPLLIKATCAPLKASLTLEGIPHLLWELSQTIDADGEPLVRWYEVRGRRVLQFPGFDRHQQGMRKEREAASRLPSFESDATPLKPPEPTPPIQSGKAPHTRRSRSGVGPEVVRSRTGAGQEQRPPKLSEVQVQVEVKGTANAVAEPFDAGPFIDAWREIRQGIPNGGLIGRTCKPVAAEVGMAEALHRWNRFLAERRHSPAAYFAQEHGQYAGLALVNGRPPPAPEPEPNWIEPPTDPDEIARLKADGFR